MMGRTHGATGVLAATAAGAYMNLDPYTMLVTAMILPGSALWPDVDHPRSTVSSTYGPITRVFSKVLGHRKITHSVLGIVGYGVLIHTAVLVRDGYPTHPYVRYGLMGVLTITLILVLAAFVRLLRGVPGSVGSWFRRSWADDFAPIPFVISIVWFSEIDLSPVAPVLIAGCLVHMIGDMMTKMGCPVLWPVIGKSYHLTTMRTNGRWEHWVIFPGVCAGIAWCIWVMITT